MCSTIENQSEKRENAMPAVPCVIFWAYESIFWFRADITAIKWILFYFKSSHKCSLGPQSQSFSLLVEQFPALRHNLMSSQVKCNKNAMCDVFIPMRRLLFFSHALPHLEVNRTTTKVGSDLASCPRTLDRCWSSQESEPAGACFTS